jgi:CheY-like chemotaxis protein
MPAERIAVLLVGENARKALTLQSHLERHKCGVRFATTLKEARDLLGKQSFDLVLCEFLCSDGTAYQLTPFLRNTQTTMFFSNPVENGCWWMCAIADGQDCSDKPGIAPGEFRIVLDQLLSNLQSKRSRAAVLAAGGARRAARSIGWNRGWNRAILVFALACVVVIGVFSFEVSAGTHASSSFSNLPTPVTIQGTVEDVVRPPCPSGALSSRKTSPNCGATNLILDTRSGRKYVQLGPTKYIRDQRFSFASGDHLWVVGFPTRRDDATAFTSERVIKEHRELVLRDRSGRPVWALNAPGILQTSRHDQTASPPRSAEGNKPRSTNLRSPIEKGNLL